MSVMLFSFTSVVMSFATEKGELRFDNAIQKGYSQTSTPLVVTSDGNVVVTGIQINGSKLGSFVALSSKELPSTPLWKVDITGGRSVVNAIVADNNGGAYIGGDFNDKISIGNFSLDGKSSSSYAKTNAFVAHINKDGEVVSVKAFRVKANPDMTSNFDTYTEGDKVYCNLNSLTFANGKLYAGMIFTDVLTSGEISITSGSWNLNSWGMGVGSDADFVVAELDQESLDATSFPVVFGGPGTYTDSSYMGFNVETAKLTGEGNSLYFACSVGGYSSKGVLKLNGEQKDEATFKYNGGLNAIYVVNLDLTTNTVVSKVYDGEYGWVSGASNLVQPGVASLSVDGDKLYVGGSFRQKLPFDKSVTAVGNTDLFFASLNKENLSLQKALTSGYDEKTADADNEEKIAGFSFDGGKLDIYGAVSKRADAYTSTSTMSTPLHFTSGDFSASTSLTSVESTDYTTGAASSVDGKYKYFAKLDAGQTNLFYEYNYTETPSGIKALEQDATKNACVYNMQGVKLRAPQKGLNIIGGKVVLVK